MMGGPRAAFSEAELFDLVRGLGSRRHLALGIRQERHASPSDPIVHLLRDVELRIPADVRDMRPQSRVNL